MSSPVKYNFGCGAKKLTGYINADINAALKPDLVLDMLKVPYPIDSESVAEICFFHTIEHIEKKYHPFILKEFHRVLEPNGTLYLAFPEFKICAKYWLENKRGMRDFWEATIFGRQMRPDDFHVSLMNTDEISATLYAVGFEKLDICQEAVPDECNTIIKCVKGAPEMTYEELVGREIFAV